MDRDINWGVIGLGNIAHRFLDSLRHFKDAKFYAGASYTESKRKEFDEKYHPVKLYDSYDALLEDKNVDVVYIALPHGMHYKWVKEALRHNKHVLVEKPSFLISQEIKEATQLSKEKNLFFMEAMKTRFIPLVDIIHQEIANGTIGEVVKVENYFNHNGMEVIPKTHYLFDKDQGGVLYDTGIYNIASILDYIHDDVVEIKNDPTFKYGVDVHDRISLTFRNGAKAYFECAMDSENKRGQIITGSKGTIKMDYFYRPTSIDIETDEQRRKVVCDLAYDDFYDEIKAVHDGIRNSLVEANRLTHQDMIDEIVLLERIYEETIKNKQEEK